MTRPMKVHCSPSGGIVADGRNFNSVIEFLAHVENRQRAAEAGKNLLSRDFKLYQPQRQVDPNADRRRT